MTSDHLLPPNATALERSLSLSTDLLTRLGGETAPLKGFKTDSSDSLLPWLIWEYGLGELLPYLPDPRRAMAEGIRWQRLRGTPAALTTALSWIGATATVEQETPGIHFAEFQFDPGQVLDDDGVIANLIAIARLSAPARSRLSRIYHGWDLRRLVLDDSRLGEALLSDHSGVFWRDGQTKLSFGRVRQWANPPPDIVLAPAREAVRFAVARLMDRYLLDFSSLGDPGHTPNEKILHSHLFMALRSVVLSAFYKVFTTSGSFRKPPGYAGVMVEVIGAGTGGTGGSVVVMQGGSSGVRNGPPGGAHGPRRAPLFFASEELDATSTVVVGAGGSGGAGAPSIGSPTGAGGGAGGASTFISAQVLSSGSAGVPEISGLRRCAAAGGKSGDVSFNYSVINVTSGDTGSANVSGTALPQGGAGAKVIGNYATTYSNDVSSGTWSATGAAGQSAAVAFCSGAGGGPAACKVSADLNGPEPLILSLTGGNGGQGGLGAGGGAGGNAVIVRGTGGGWTDNVSATYTLRGGNGGNGGPGLVSVWGVI